MDSSEESESRKRKGKRLEDGEDQAMDVPKMSKSAKVDSDDEIEAVVLAALEDNTDTKEPCEASTRSDGIGCNFAESSSKSAMSVEGETNMPNGTKLKRDLSQSLKQKRTVMSMEGDN